MSNKGKMNVPELRFPEFEGEWEEKKLEDTLEFIKDGTHGTHENVNKGPWLLSAKNIKNNKIIISSDDRKISESDYKKIYKNYKLEKGDLLLTIVGTIGRAAIVKNPNNIAFQRSVAILKTKATYDVEFIFQLFQTNYFKNLLLRKQVVSAQPGLYLGDIRKIKISITNIIEEQRKIGIFFRKIDRQIELEEQKLELLQQQKKGYMQKIFSQELRFKDEDGEDYPDWEEKKLGDITEQSMYGIGASAIEFDSKNIYIRITDIDEKSRKLNYQNLTTPDELNNKYKLKRNDILFARTGASTGKSYIHKEEKDIYNYYFAGFLIKFEINEQNSPLFIYQFTLTSKFNNWVKVMSVRSGQPGINSEEYAKLPLVLPNKLEQQKIAKFLDRFDQQIELEKQKIETLQQQKKSLLQSMFI
ncbi:restriction endonuclease subunit S [Staphylococcus aureus]|nr:restriction endonuclease subunit S [Staphylococcus aureus]UXT29712.1 restriction endonuclease subunit S [Staphylococcus aureus]UXU14671.1 restriction endonuclease subunit S [Staphylococcus aureus]